MNAEKVMDKFEGNGAECMVRFIADGCKGHIQVNDGSMVFGETAWRKQGLWQLDWLDKSCTYFTPEPEWVECTPGEALDAYLGCEQVQENSGSGWADMTYEVAWQWMWVNRGVKYRREV